MSRHQQAASAAAREGSKRLNTADLERWEIDPGRSSLTFALRHLVISEIRGRFGRWGGTLFFDRKEPLLSSLHVWVELATIDTDSAERDEQLRSSEFLDVKRFVRAEFESSSVEPRDGRALVRGRLDLHGVMHDVEVEVDPFTPPAQDGTTYRVRGKLDRQNFGLHWNQDLDVGGVVVGDEIAVTAELTVVRQNGDAKDRS